MAVIRERKKGKFTIQLFMGRDPVTDKSKFYIETVTGNKSDAKKRLAELEHELNTGTIVNPSKYTVQDLLEDYLREHAKPNTRIRTYEGYEMMARVHLIPALGSIPLHKLQPSHVQKYITDKIESGLSNRTVKHQYKVLSQALVYAVGLQRVGRNVCDAVKAPKVMNKEMNPMDEYQVNAFLDIAKDHRCYNLYHLAIFTGMRREELLGLRWKDIEDYDIYVDQVATQRKGGSYIYEAPKNAKSKRRISIDIATSLELVRYKEYKRSLEIKCNDNDIVFADLQGVPFKADGVSKSFKKLLKKLDITDVRFHDLRHTHASLMLKQNVNPKIIQERLGHSSITVTMDTYGHLMPTMQTDAVQNFADLIKNARTLEAVEMTG